MTLTAVIYQEIGARSRKICEAMKEGITRMGDQASLVQSYQYPGRPSGDIAVFYGLKDGKDQMFKDYVKAGRHVVFIDLGYWGRHHSAGKHLGHHRFTVDRRHPHDLVMRFDCPGDRFERFGHRLKPMKRDRLGDFILLAGQSRKSAHSYGWGSAEWEIDTVNELRKHTDRLIVYRPKPSWKGARPIKGTRFSPREERLEGLLERAYCVVTHHSNVAIDGLIRGVPCFLDDGIALPMGKGPKRLDEIEDPFYPDDDTRLKWLHNVAWWNWDIAEMKAGLPWQFIRQTGLLYE